MLVKVCGIRNDEDLKALMEVETIDMIGFIHVPQSPRFVGKTFIPSEIKTKKVGVFKDAHIDYISRANSRIGFDFIQLHGNETPEFCKIVSELAPVIKAFSIKTSDSLDETKGYEGICDYFLFDTPSRLGGGSGKQFDWSVLSNYQGETSFILSGGIGPEDIKAVQELHHPKLAGIDINSRFETRPGKKDIPLIQTFLNELKHEIID